jgi:hypothetical protein
MAGATREAIAVDVHALQTAGIAGEALERCLTTLHELSGALLDSTPAVRQAVAVTLADIRDLAAGATSSPPGA